MSEYQILIIDDDIELCELLEDYLGRDGFAIEAVHDGRQGVDRALSGAHQLVLLDVMLPSLNGFDALRAIRERSEVPVLMLTARGEAVDRIVGIELGADDYLPKPFNPRELVARMRAILRRAQPAPLTPGRQEQALVIGELMLAPSSRRATLADQELELTSVEFQILEILVRQAGQVVSREQLSQEALERPYHPLDRSLDVHLSNLRKKLGGDSRGRNPIVTVRGAGYIYAH